MFERKFNHLILYRVGYFTHMRRALGFATKSFFWTCEVFIHAFYPDVFVATAAKMKAEIDKLERPC